MAADINLYTASEEVTAHYEKLPETLEEAKAAAKASAFVAENLPASIIADYTE